MVRQRKTQKRLQSWVNGRFGFGVHAFRAEAERIRFRTKYADDKLIHSRAPDGTTSEQ